MSSLDVPPEVIDGCKRGDDVAFAQLINLTHRAVYSQALRITGNPEDAADVAQQTYIKLVSGIKQFRGDAKFSTWLYRVNSNVAVTHLRKKQRRRADVSLDSIEASELPAPDSSDPAAIAQQHALRDRLDDALRTLPEGYRAVAVMKDVYGQSFEDISSQLKISEGTARVRLHRARRRLRELLSSEQLSTAEAKR
jgi:RNA polymerase sigma-70 factor, ECF subfamily